MKIRAAALLLLSLSASAAAEPLATFQEAVIPGAVAGSSLGPSAARCTGADVAAPANMPGRAEIVAPPAALGAADPDTRVLLLATSPASGADTLAQTRWELIFEAREPSLLHLRMAFVTSDLATLGDWWSLLLDGRPFACGDAGNAPLDARDVLAPGDRATAWMDLGGGLPIDPGMHVLTVAVGDGTDSTGQSALLIDSVYLASSQPPPPCSPAPPEDVGEIPFQPGVNPRRWTFDDNRFCSGGPALDCSRCLSGAPAAPPPSTPCPTPGDQLVNPNSGFEDSTNQSFEMYVVADCGQTMHLPLYDVESGCISVFDETRFPVAISVTNGAGFNASGGEVCWSASDCTGGLGNNPGGPGNERVMDVSFTGDPALCGVYIVNFRSWAGCIWDLYANCDGTGSEGFLIYDDFCDAQAAVNPLPEYVIDSMFLSSGVGCFVDFCVVVRNIGCATGSPFTLRVQNEIDLEDYLLTLGSGSQAQICGRLDVLDVGPMSPTTVTATADFGNAVLECTENPAGSHCDPATGADTRSQTTTVECNRAPTCDAGGPYRASCAIPGPQSIPLNGSGSFDPDGFPLTYAWTTNCPGSTIDFASTAFAVLRVPGVSCTTCLVTLTVTDTAGVSATCSSLVDLGDTQPPIVSCPASQNLECAGPGAHDAQKNAWLASGTANDACSGARPVSAQLVSSTTICPGSTFEVWRFSATDACGNVGSCERQWNERDTQPPQVTPPAPQVVSCTAPASALAAWLASASASDACAGSVPVTPVLLSEQSPCTGTTISTYRFDAMDPCGNLGTATSTFERRDDAPPAVAAPPDATVPCHAVPPPGSPTVSDACDPSPSVIFAETSTPGACPQERTILRTWTATDACGNAASAQQRLTVVDTEPPSMAGVPPDATVECDAIPPPGSPTAADACDPSPSIQFQETSTPGACPQERTILRTWTATDACGNAASAQQRLTVVDTRPPSLAGVPPDATVECDAIPPPGSPTAADACDPSPSIQFQETSTPGSCPQERTILRTWTATDACGNAASAQQRLTVVDTRPPALSGVPADATVECDAIPPPGSPAAADACDPSPSIQFQETSIPGSCPQERTILRTWTATDACGNAASAQQRLTVVDTRPPTLSGVPADASVSCASVPPPATVTASDACDPSPSVTFVETSTRSIRSFAGDRRFPDRGGDDGRHAASHCPDDYVLVRTWTATDACGNSASASQTLTVTDFVAPTLSGVPPDATVACNAVPPPATVTATDDCDPAPGVAFAETRVDGPCPNTYTLHRDWTATDRCANAASRRQVVQVVDDQPPTINPPTNLTVECPAPSAGPQSEAAWLASATATDGCGGATVMTNELSRTPGCGATYVAVFDFWAVDDCSNSSPHVSRSYTVVDTTPPVLTPPPDVTVECPAPSSGPQSEAGWLGSASASDGCGAATVMTSELSRTPGCGATYVAVFDLWAVDACGNSSAHVQRTYTVEDTTPPVLAAPPDLTVECPPPSSGPQSEESWRTSATATDTCGPATASWREISRVPGCGNTFVATYEFWATDACANESAREQRRYVVVDTTPPVFGGTPDDQFRLSIWPPNHGYVVYSTADLVAATDACGATDVRVTGCRSSQPEEVHQGPTDDGGNGDGRFAEDCVLSVDGTQFAVRAERLGSCGASSMRVYSIAFTATDECGNSAPGAGRVVVEHDRSGHQDVRRGRKLGPNDPPPFPYVHPTIYGTGCGP